MPQGYTYGYALFMWDLTPDGSGAAYHMHPEYRGQVTIKGVHGTNRHSSHVGRLRRVCGRHGNRC